MRVRTRLTVVLAGGVLVLLGGLPLRAATPGGGLGEALGAGRVVTGVTPHRILHFTFDDGPDPSTTPRLLDAMDRLGVKATFFFSASRFRGHERRNAHAREIARDALRRGHSVGTHSVDHIRMRALAPAKLRQQLQQSDALFRDVFGKRTFLFRPPFGSRNRALDRMLDEQGYTTVMWNIGVADWVRRSPEALARTFERVMRRLETRQGQRGGVVLLHDTHSWSIDGFVQIVERLQQRNCQLLDGDGELYELVDDLSLFIVPVDGAAPGTDAPVLRLSPQVLAVRQRALRQREAVRCARATTASVPVSAPVLGGGTLEQAGAGELPVAEALGDGAR